MSYLLTLFTIIYDLGLYRQGEKYQQNTKKSVFLVGDTISFVKIG